MKTDGQNSTGLVRTKNDALETPTRPGPRYIIVSSYSMDGLGSEVSRRMEDGYTPTGGLTFIPNADEALNEFAQAMIYQPNEKGQP